MASKMAAKDKQVIVFPKHKYIFRIIMSESCFNCTECLFLILTDIKKRNTWIKTLIYVSKKKAEQ